MTARPGPRLAWSLWSLTLLCAAAAAVLLFANRPMEPGRLVRDGLVPDAVAITYGSAGAFIASRRPRNWIGWILLLFGFSFGLGDLAAEYAVRGLVTAPGSLPGARAAAWFQFAAGGTIFPVLLPLLLLLFPDGRLPSRRWRPVVWLTLAEGLGITAVVAVSQTPLTSAFRRVPLGPNPLGLMPLTAAVGAGLGILEIAVLALAAAATIVRLVRSRGAERQQLQWLALAGAATALAVGATSVLQGLAGEVALDALVALLAVGLPAAIVLAVLRHRLLDVEVVIQRSLVYAALALFITAVYVGGVVGVGTLVGTQERPDLALSILATAVVAVAFQPVRERFRRLANRLVYGRRASPYEAMAELSHRVAGATSVEEVLPALAELAARAVGAPGGHVRLLLPGGEEVAAAWPAGAGPTAPAGTAAVVDRGEAIGEISVLQVPGEVLAPSQRLLLADLAVQAGPALRSVRLTSELRSRVAELSARAQQLRESRERLVTAADAQRRRLEEEIQAGTRRRLTAIGGRLEEASQLLGTDPARARDLLDRLADEAQVALDGLRDLARGIFPPLLAERGLAPALQAHLRKVGLEADLEVGPEVAGARFDPEVEAALYFCSVEALQHAARSRPGLPVTIRLVAGDGWLELTAPRPDGPAFDDVADRIEAVGGTLRSEPGAPLTARVPVSRPAGPG